MSRLLKIIFLLALFCLVSCKPIYKELNGINKSIHFQDNKEYKEYVVKHTKLNPDKFIFIDNKELYRFYTYLNENKIVYYYGVLDNNYLIANGSSLIDKNVCYGSIITAIKKEVDQQLDHNSNSVKEDFLTSFNFTDIDGKSQHLSQTRKTIVFVYSYKLGNVVSNISDIIDALKEEGMDYIVVSLDSSSIISLRGNHL